MGGDAGGWCGDRLGDLATLYKLGDTARLATIQAVCWSLTGLGIGLGAALSSTADRRATARKAAGGFLGGLLGGGVYPFAAAVAGIFLPDSPTNGLVPESTADQLIWLSAAAISIGVGIQAVGSGQPPADEHGISARRPLFLTGCLIVLLAAWTWQFRPPRSPVPAGSHDSEDDCLPAGSSVDYAADEPAEERKAHLLGLDAESRWITAGERFPELRVGGWLKGHPTAEDLRGRVLVIDVWDGMCIGCRQAVPCLVHAHERFHGRGVAFIGLTAAGRADAERFLGDTQITWPNGYGAKPTLEALGSSVPTIYVIDPDGRICWTDRRARYTHQVAFLAGELKQAIEEALRRQQSTGK
ncbi:MAG TPA: TlpA disulfide reductase family protein [Pirellulales bacterium]|nr:TlpA disulfide reductase family protein [Pirellulales bacterium]